MTLLEICLDDLEGAVAAERAGADRIELCAALGTGGITPSIGTVVRVLDTLRTTSVHVLIRQRAGDFVYDEGELAAMIADIHAIHQVARSSAVDVGFVVGALRPDDTIDLDTTAALVRACGDASVTFHKAFDQTPDVGEALEQLIDLGIDRVLTSGGAANAVAGAESLAALVGRAADRIGVLAGGGVRNANVVELVRRAGITEVHLRANVDVPSRAVAASASSTATSAASAYDSGARAVTSEPLVAQIRATLDQMERVA